MFNIPKHNHHHPDFEGSGIVSTENVAKLAQPRFPELCAFVVQSYIIVQLGNKKINTCYPMKMDNALSIFAVADYQRSLVRLQLRSPFLS